MPGPKAIDVWREKLEALQVAEATESDAAQKFELAKQIAEAKEKIAALQRDGSAAAVPSGPKIAPSRLFLGSHKGPKFLIGREEELAALDAVFNDTRKKNVVTIVAWGGIGKTSLVAHWAARKLAQRNRDGIERYFDWSFFSQGAHREGEAGGGRSAASADLFIKEALEFFGDPALASGSAGPRRKGERLVQLVSEHRSLLILDGLEPLQDAKSGELRDEALQVLLAGLAANNKGLCLITTRQHLPELELWHETTAPEWKLAKLSREAGGELLQKLGVNGTPEEREQLAADLKGHALTLALLGKYLAEAHGGDIRKRDLVSLSEADYEETSGHAFHVMEVYEQWLLENNRVVELSILRLLGLFDRPATPDCVDALRRPPAILGLTDSLINLTDAQWSVAKNRLMQLGLIEEQIWEPRSVVGYSKDIAIEAMEAGKKRVPFPIGEPAPFESRRIQVREPRSIDAHPLIREFFANRLQGTAPGSLMEAHSRLFDHLRTSVPFWPDGLEGLQPLYQAVAHGCRAGRHQETCDEVYADRIYRGTAGSTSFYSEKKLGAISANLAALGCFFTVPWTQPATQLAEVDRVWILGEAGRFLRSAGRLAEAREPITRSLEFCKENSIWLQAAQSASNLTGLLLTLGDIASSVREGKESVNLADLSTDGFMREVCRTVYAEALHQAGRAEARSHFDDAETIHRERRPEYPLLYGLQGFRFSELLLADDERAAWKRSLQARKRLQNETVTAAYRVVQPRALRTHAWVAGKLSILEEAQGNLTLGRVALYGAILEESSLEPCQSPLDSAVAGFHQGGKQEYLVRGLLTRAWLHSLENEPAKAKALIDEALQIAERGPMRLNLADIYLHRARLFFRTDPYPWNTNPDGTARGPRDDLAAARRLIVDCGYGRRLPELEDAERAIPGG